MSQLDLEELPGDTAWLRRLTHGTACGVITILATATSVRAQTAEVAPPSTPAAVAAPTAEAAPPASDPAIAPTADTAPTASGALIAPTAEAASAPAPAAAQTAAGTRPTISMAVARWSASARAEDALVSRPSPTPPLSAARIVGEAGLGLVTGFAVGVGGLLGGAALDEAVLCKTCFIGPGAVVGAALGVAAGAPIGVSLIGRSGEQTGSIGATCLGALIGGAVGFGAGVAIVEAGHSDTADLIAWSVIIASPTIGAVIGFNATRRYESSVTLTPTASVGMGQSTFGITGQF